MMKRVLGSHWLAAALISLVSSAAGCAGVGALVDAESGRGEDGAGGGGAEIVAELPGTGEGGGPELPGAGEIGEETAAGCQPGEGCFGELCQEGSDCLSGLCVDHLGDKVCSQQCVEECPAGFSCTQVGGGGPDVMWLCISNFRTLCRPCRDHRDCVSAGGEELCIQYGQQGRFCGGDCGGFESCPEGYECTALAAGRETTSQCLRVDGECPCSALSVALAAATVCEVGNQHGTCSGQRLCTAEGLSACDAPEAAAESCNGLDDDCDGQVDEGKCDDGNACTADLCAGSAGCQHDPLTGTNCDDGNACTLTDHCEEGECVGTLIACNDNDPCTDDQCDGLTGCLFVANNAPCDDGNPCTAGDQCQNKKCVGVALPCDCTKDSDCLQYEDGNLCNGKLYCDKNGPIFQCKVDPDSLVLCPPAAGPCQVNLCQPATGSCQAQPANEGSGCEDGDLCTWGESCQQGLCTGGKPLNCNDGKECTADSCNPKTGCLNQPLTGPACSDGNACTWPDLCGQGECAAGAAVSCDDGNPCTADSCHPGTGCQHLPAGGACDDGNACTLGDLCQGGLCLPGKAKDCDDANICTDDSCLPATGCLHQFNLAPCSDANVCTVNDMCLNGLCVAGKKLACDDANECTNDSCNQLVGCVYTNNGGGCDDLDPCTVTDSCSGGVCVGLGLANCSDGNPCTDDFCVPMAGCSHKNNLNPCSDGNLCTAGDLCDKGQCAGGKPLTCNDNNPCTDDSCDPLSGCAFSPNQANCNDGNTCTLGDTCKNGKCQASTSLNCDDSNPCTDDSCDPAAGCQHKNNSLACNDGDLCTLGDLCQGGLCKGQSTKLCNDFNPCTDDLCDPPQGCLFVPNQAPCSDFNACTDGDYCAQGWCLPGAIVDCGDQDPCTTDSCDLEKGCLHTLNTAPCDDADICTVGDSCLEGLCQPGGPLNCNDGNSCTDDSCDPGAGCQHQPNNAGCEDGSVCTENDQCSAGWCQSGPTIACDDDNSCTKDSCDALNGCANTALPDNTICADDGKSCTSDLCQEGQCVHSGDGWSGYNNRCYRYFPETKNWFDARAACQALGGDLTSIANAAENTFVHSIILPKEVAPWIGFNDQNSEGSWGWSDGSAVTYTNWAASEPNNSGNEDCAHLYVYATSPQDSRWNDAQCSSGYGFVCERP